MAKKKIQDEEIAKARNSNTLNENFNINFDNLIDHYSRINVPILPRELIENLNFKINDNFINYSKTLEKIRTSLSTLNLYDSSESIGEVKEIYKKGKLVFVLGAGVSMGYGLPTWETMLQKLMVTTLEKDKDASNIISKLFSKLFNPSPLIAGRYLQKYFETKNENSFEDAVRAVLYEEINKDISSRLMDEIVRYCVAAGNSPVLDSIITYNFDNILEENLKKSGFDLAFKSVFGTGTEVEHDELSIYHVHGFLPEFGELTKANQITFGETIYHQQYNDIYSWNNIVQINKFRENNCIFIGTSLTDPNTRRLLDIANQQRTSKRGSHYIFKLRNSKEDLKKALSILLNQNEELLSQKSHANLKIDDTVKTLIQTVESFEENDFNSFGIKTIWINSYDEIPKILKKIRSR